MYSTVNAHRQSDGYYSLALEPVKVIVVIHPIGSRSDSDRITIESWSNFDRGPAGVRVRSDHSQILIRSWSDHGRIVTKIRLPLLASSSRARLGMYCAFSIIVYRARMYKVRNAG